MICSDSDHECCLKFMNQYGEAHVIFELEDDMDWFLSEAAKAVFCLLKARKESDVRA